ncbi:protein FMC1 homolog [Pelodytes ibericus]
MSALGSPVHTFRCLLRELRYLRGASRYRETALYSYIRDNFRRNKVTSEKFCRAQQEMHFQASTYLCLLRSVRNHVVLHEEYHGKGERSPEEVAGLVGLKLPQQPGGKGWER